MNINLNISSSIQQSLQDTIDESARVLTGPAGINLTGMVALVLDENAEIGGVYQVWFHKAEDGMWMWVDSDGRIHEQLCPLDDGTESEHH